MARLTKEERAELEARLAEDDEDDESDEVTVAKADGSSFTGSFRRALQLGLVTKPEPKTDPKAKPPRVSVLSPRRTGSGS